MAIDGGQFRCDHFPCHAEWDRIAEDMRLSPQETWRVRRLIAGHSEESIARDEGLSVGVVRAEDAALYAKLGVRSREELIALLRANHEKRLAEGKPTCGCPLRQPAARLIAIEGLRLELLFEGNLKAAITFALRLGGNRKELAEEIFAAAWFLAVCNWQTYDPAKPFQPWLFQIMCHALHHMTRCREQAEGGGSPGCPILGVPDMCPDCAADAELRDLLDKLRALAGCALRRPHDVAQTLLGRPCPGPGGGGTRRLAANGEQACGRNPRRVEGGDRAGRYPPPPRANKGKEPRSEKSKKFRPNRE